MIVDDQTLSNSKEEGLSARKIRLLQKYDRKCGRAFEQGKFDLAGYWANRISTTLEIFGRTNENKKFCLNWIRLHQSSRDFNQYKSEEKNLKLRKISLPSSCFQEMIYPVVLYCSFCGQPFYEGFEKEDHSVYCTITCAKKEKIKGGK